jgi:DnaK suppressor protein
MATTNKQRTDLDLTFFRERLNAERRLAEETIAGTQRQEGGDSPTDPDEMAAFDENKTSEDGTELSLRSQDVALIENARNILGLIERAEAKLADGTYGISDRSGERIPKERLEAIPYATLTAGEQEIQELN